MNFLLTSPPHALGQLSVTRTFLSRPAPSFFTHSSAGSRTRTGNAGTRNRRELTRPAQDYSGHHVWSEVFSEDLGTVSEIEQS